MKYLILEIFDCHLVLIIDLSLIAVQYSGSIAVQSDSIVIDSVLIAIESGSIAFAYYNNPLF